METLFHYDSDSTIPLKLDTTTLLQLISEPFDSILLIGHSDDVGDDSYNLKLSNRRAMYMKRLLQGLNINEDGIRTAYFGERAPKYENKNEKNRAKNRRAEMVIYRPEVAETLATMPVNSALLENIDIDGNYELYSLLKERSFYQYFTISNAKDTVITTSAGVLIYFPEGCFRSNRLPMRLKTPAKSVIHSTFVQMIPQHRLRRCQVETSKKS